MNQLNLIVRNGLEACVSINNGNSFWISYNDLSKMREEVENAPYGKCETIIGKYQI